MSFYYTVQVPEHHRGAFNIQYRVPECHSDELLIYSTEFLNAIVMSIYCTLRIHELYIVMSFYCTVRVSELHYEFLKIIVMSIHCTVRVPERHYVSFIVEYEFQNAIVTSFFCRVQVFERYCNDFASSSCTQ